MKKPETADLPAVTSVNVERWVGEAGQLFDTKEEAERSVLEAKLVRILEEADIYWRDTVTGTVAEALLKDAARLGRLLSMYAASKG